MHWTTTVWWSSLQSILKSEQTRLSNLRTVIFGKIWHPILAISWCKASCLTHVINLTTQALIKGHSKAKYYSSTKPDEHVPNVDAILRDEVGLIRMIAVKVSLLYYEGHPMCQNFTMTQIWSSAKWKELFWFIQSERLTEKDHLNSKSGHVKQLILDMPVCWSSTYSMLHHAATLQEVSRKASLFRY